MNQQNQWLFEAPYSEALYGIDAMTTPPLRSVRGGQKGRVRTDISPWPGLLRRAIQTLQNAIRYLGPPINFRDFDRALLHADSLIRNAMREVSRVMSGSRRTSVLDQLSNAVTRIQYAGSQVRGQSLHGGRSLIDPSISLQGAINHIRQAQQAVGLQLSR